MKPHASLPEFPFPGLVTLGLCGLTLGLCGLTVLLGVQLAPPVPYGTPDFLAQVADLSAQQLRHRVMLAACREDLDFAPDTGWRVRAWRERNAATATDPSMAVDAVDAAARVRPTDAAAAPSQEDVLPADREATLLAIGEVDGWLTALASTIRNCSAEQLRAELSGTEGSFRRVILSALIDDALRVPLVFVPVRLHGFMMGSDPRTEQVRDPDETWHRVNLSGVIEVMPTPVTQFQFKAVLGRNPSQFVGETSCHGEYLPRALGGPMCPNQPVERVTHADALAFVAAMNKRDPRHVHRLPTEAEREFLNRAGSDTTYSFGNDRDALVRYAWNGRNSGGHTHPVASLLPNAFGLFDMQGHVWEWCSDWYGEYPAGECTNPQGPLSGTRHVARGGGWTDDDAHCRSANRGCPASEDGFLGFRIVRVRAR